MHALHNDGHRQRRRGGVPDLELGAGDQETLAGFGKVFAGPKWKAADYRDLALSAFLFLLTKTMKSRASHRPGKATSRTRRRAIFSRFPKVMKDHFAVDFICDTLR